MSDKENDKTILEEENLENVAGGYEWDHGDVCFFIPTSREQTNFGLTTVWCGYDTTSSCLNHDWATGRGVACSCKKTSNCWLGWHMVDENHKPVCAIHMEWRT